MSNRRIIGVDWNAVGRGALGVGHVTGKLLLNAFAGGAGVSQIDELQEKGGQLPDWAAKAPTLVATKPTKVVVLDKNDKPRTFENSTKVTVRGGKRSEVDGGAIVEGPNKVEIEQPSGTQRPEVKAILVTGGVQPQEQPQQGLGSIVRVTGDLMDDMDNIDVNLEVVSEPSDEGTIDVFGEISSDRSMPLEMRLAQHRLSQAQARLAATQAKQPRTPAALPPMNIQNYDLTQPQGSLSMEDDLLDPNLLSELSVLGHSDDAGWTEIYGDAQGWEEIVGGMTPAQRKKLEAYMKKIKGIIVSGDVDGCDEVLGSSQGWSEIIGEMTPGQKKKLQAYLKKIKKVILSGEWDEIEGDGDSDYFVGVDCLGEDESPMVLHESSAEGAQIVEDAFDGDFDVLGAVPAGAAARVLQPAKPGASARSTVSQRKSVPPRAVSKKASPPATPTKGKRSPQRKTKRASLVRKPSAFDAAIKNATKTVTGAKTRAAKLDAKLKQIKAKANGISTTVRGDDVLGALSNVNRPSLGRTPTTPKQKAAARNLDRARSKLASAITKAQKKAADLPSKANTLAKKVTATTPLVKQVLTKKATFPAPGRKATTVRGDIDILGEVDWTEVLGYMPGEELYNEQLDGPYGTNQETGEVYTSPQPGYGTGGASASSSDASAPYTPPSFDAPCVLPAEVPLPPRGQALSADDAWSALDAMPADAIPYDGSRGLPKDSVGSAILFYGAEGPNAYRDGGVTDGFKWGRGRNALEDSDMMEDGWVHRDLKGSVQASGPQGHWAAGLSNEDIEKRKGLAAAPGSWGRDMLRFWNTYQVYSMHGIAQNVPQVHAHSMSVGWGPLVGNPNGILAGLRYLPTGGPNGEGVWFWMPENAPAWATSKVDGEIKKLNMETRATAQAECDAQKALDAIEQAERERDRAAKEYDLSMATNQQEVEAAINADKLAQAQMAADAQLAQQQAQMEMQADQAYLQWQIQQAKLEQQTQAAALQYAMQNPEEVQQYEQAAPGGEQGFDETPAADEFVNEGFFEGTTTDRAEEEEIMEQTDRVPEELDFIPQEGAISDVDLGPEEF